MGTLELTASLVRHREHDLADVIAGLHSSVSIGRGRQRKRPVDHRNVGSVRKPGPDVMLDIGCDRRLLGNRPGRKVDPVMVSR